jgi:hypothetical protein
MSRLPLPNDLCRCLGREKSGDRKAPTLTGKGCKKADSCARHLTIRWDRFDGTLHVHEHLCEIGGKHEHFIPAYAEGQP